ncbi:uncharacterized protein LOC134210511 [Armigeres subalbatus]|uniref:uncharacterized protein LOC134210511 n=1 Tax=Armigeres subalbatus TaxID=124917 RepID=UPI002ED570F8
MTFRTLNVKTRATQVRYNPYRNKSVIVTFLSTALIAGNYSFLEVVVSQKQRRTKIIHYTGKRKTDATCHLGHWCYATPYRASGEANQLNKKDMLEKVEYPAW